MELSSHGYSQSDIAKICKLSDKTEIEDKYRFKHIWAKEYLLTNWIYLPIYSNLSCYQVYNGMLTITDRLYRDAAEYDVIIKMYFISIDCVNFSIIIVYTSS